MIDIQEVFMKLRVFLVAAAAVLVGAAPALAQSQTYTSNGTNSYSDGSSVSGEDSSSGGTYYAEDGETIVVVEGPVEEGEVRFRSSDDDDDDDDVQGGSRGSHDDVDNGQVVGPTASDAVSGGIVAKLDMPALHSADALPAAKTRSGVVTWAVVAVMVLGLGLLYRRLPRPTDA